MSPARSKAQRAVFAIAEHHPEQLQAKNAKLADLPRNTLHDFAATPSKGLPWHVPKGNRYSRPKGR